MSNILSVFSPPTSSRDLSEEECLPCTAIQSLTGIGCGLYLFSNSILKDKNGFIDPTKHPRWWQISVKSTGFILLTLGAYRAGEVFQMATSKKGLLP